MARRLRLQYRGAIYHLMARGNARQEIVCDDADRERLQEDLGKAGEHSCFLGVGDIGVGEVANSPGVGDFANSPGGLNNLGRRLSLLVVDEGNMNRSIVTSPLSTKATAGRWRPYSATSCRRIKAFILPCSTNGLDPASNSACGRCSNSAKSAHQVDAHMREQGATAEAWEAAVDATCEETRCGNRS